MLSREMYLLPVTESGTGETSEVEISRDERSRLSRLERAARREARSRESEARRERRLASREFVGGRTGSSTIVRRLRRGFVVGLSALLLVSLLVPPFLIPVEGAITSRFFIRNAPDSVRLFDFEHHTGLDIAAAAGTPVIASRSGRVVATGNDPRYGLYIDLRHPAGWVTRYAHLSRIAVADRAFVWRGRRIGAVGSTGRATGPHLHFELRIAGRSFPPGFLLVFHRLRRTIWEAARSTG